LRGSAAPAMKPSIKQYAKPHRAIEPSRHGIPMTPPPLVENLTSLIDSQNQILR
jgi:hypothetical protein